MLAAMPHRFDALHESDLRERPLYKWRRFAGDVLPMWVADMDYPVAEPVRAAIRAYADGDAFGYGPPGGLPGVREAVVERLERRFGWSVPLEAVRIIPSTVAGLFTAVKAFASGDDGVVSLTPVYPPFRMAVERQGRTFQSASLAETNGGFRLDPEALDAAITPATRLLMLCHPHNPTGRVFDRGELNALAERVLAHRLFVVSDELHADLNHGPTHLPFASLGPELARRTVTLYGPTKAFNLAGVKGSFAICENPEVLDRFEQAAFGFALSAPNVSQLAAAAAFRDGDPWLDDTLAYLRGNLDRLAGAVGTELPGVRMHRPDATYLAWLDFRDTPLADDPAGLLLDRGRLGLNDGPSYGAEGRGFARLNVATSRALLDEAITRMARALADGRGAAAT